MTTQTNEQIAPLALVTGASGFLGAEIARLLEAEGWRVLRQAFSQSAENCQTCDLRDSAACTALLEAWQPAAVIHAAAYRDPDFCETQPDEARRLNRDSVAYLCDALLPGSRLLFISSDYVFGGGEAPYAETCSPCPVNVYGQLKAEAEDLALSRPENLVLRIPVLVGADPSPQRRGFISQMIDDLQAPNEVAVDDICVRFPTWIRDVARATNFLLRRSDTSGAYHCSSPLGGTRYALTQTVARCLNRSTEHLRPGSAADQRAARRPDDAQLTTQRMVELGFEGFTPLPEILKALGHT